MPRFDGTGPTGHGPRNGRGAGGCNAAPAGVNQGAGQGVEQCYGQPGGYGRGRGHGFKARQRGRVEAGWGVGPDCDPEPQERELLARQKDALSRQLDQITARLNALERESTD